MKPLTRWMLGGLVVAPGFATADAPTSQPGAPPPGTSASQPAASRPAAPTRTPDTPVVEDEITVQSTLSEALRQERSAEAVDVVALEKKRSSAADLGQVLAAEEGVAVRRGGGLGAGSRFSLNGLYDDQIRFFLDGVPLDLAGYSAGLANLPIELIERVELYRGVVPIRLGSDALGGAVNLVSFSPSAPSRVTASLLAGSFGTYRAALTGRWRLPRGLVVDARGFADAAENNYRVEVEVPDDVGRLQPVTVERFHDAYRAAGGSVELGWLARPWAERLSLRLHASAYDKELQHNAVMTVPFGEAVYGEGSYGATLRYEQSRLWGGTGTLQLIASAGYRQVNFRDESAFVYDWLGVRIQERRTPGEVFSAPSDQSLWQRGLFGRAYASRALHPAHELRLALSPYLVSRTGDERLDPPESQLDPLNATQDLVTLNGGLELQSRALGGRLENIAALKGYLFYAQSQELLFGGGFTDRRQDRQLFGFGDALRYELFPGAYAKISLERTARLPGPNEIFGDGVLVAANLDLQPEQSRNQNYGLQLAGLTRAGSWRGELSFFSRQSENLIVLLGNQQDFSYQNVFGALTQGAELSGGWTSPGGRLSLDANTTYQAQRNTSAAGTFGEFVGDRIPNRPWFFANLAASARQPGLLIPGDELSVGWDTRYVHGFFRTWESIGREDTKQVIPAQLLHGARLAYRLPRGEWALVSSVEAQNLTDADSFDFFGVQRPGRAFFCKLTMER